MQSLNSSIDLRREWAWYQKFWKSIACALLTGVYILNIVILDFEIAEICAVTQTGKA